jgi:exopolyphosphatase/guanosine-5'-triphosphate,3'-diphosphate pyrophosphatase
MPGPLLIAVVDIGSNSIKLLIARTHKTRLFSIDHFSRATTRIGASEGRISTAAVNVNANALTAFRGIIQSYDCRHVFAFGTHALRLLHKTTPIRSRTIVRRLEKSVGAPIRILSGKEEARCAYLSAMQNLQLVKRHTVLVDVGGGSTELVVTDSGRVRHARSLPFGALGLTERFVHSDPIDANEFSRLAGHVDSKWRRIISATGLDEQPAATIDLAASGGTIGTLALVIAGRATFPKQRTGKPKITIGQVQRFLDRCLELPLCERKRIIGLEPERADIICAGLAIILFLMRNMNKRLLYPNRGGVREGALIHLLKNGLRW